MAYNFTTGRVSHPAKKWYLFTLIPLALAVLLAFIAVFVPIAWKDLAPGQRVFAYPFKSCIVNTFSDIHEVTCTDNDFINANGFPLTAGDRECRAYLQATVAWVFVSVILGLVTCLFIIFLITKLWTKPLLLGLILTCWLFFLFIMFCLQWIMFLVYAHHECGTGGNAVWPVHGYSYGFICLVFSSWLALMAFLISIIALLKIKKFKPDEPWEAAAAAGAAGSMEYPSGMGMGPEYAAYPMPMDYPMAPPGISPYPELSPTFGGW